MHDWSNLAYELDELGSVRAIAKKYGCGRSSVQYQIKKHNLSYLVNILNCKDRDLKFGRYAEIKALKLLPGSIDMNELEQNAPYDILWEGKKINVRARNKHASTWCFSTKSKEKCDYFMFMLYENHILLGVYLIPSLLTTGKNYVVNIKDKSLSKFRISAGVQIPCLLP